MNDPRSWPQGSRSYEQHRVVDDMNGSRSWSQGPKWWDKLESLCILSLNQVSNMHNYHRLFLNPMHNGKIKIIYFITIQKVLMKAIPKIWMFPNQNPHGEDEYRNHKSLINLKSSTRWLKPWSWHTFGGEKKRVEAMNLFGWWKTIAMETLTLRGYL